MTTTRQWEPALYLDTEEAQLAYLEEALSDANGDAKEVLRALGTVARAQGLPQIAEEIGISKQGLYKSLGESGNPSWETVCKVAESLGLRLSFAPKAVGE